ncbi:MAG TPA: helix-turn-helix domain-containing protein [Patescibacteria group bacterium]|jgi:DNA-binding HxlR family transcriptional regulator|nr:helix-turn-helix domain-containing protein [Patescibacteria group bacterium]
MKHTYSSLETKNGCIASAMNIIGNKWTALILRDLADGVNRFTDLEQSITGINPRTLSQRLDDLENQAIISKKSFAEVPPHIEYSLTPKGQDLIPVLRQMAAWGNKYFSGTKKIPSAS